LTSPALGDVRFDLRVTAMHALFDPTAPHCAVLAAWPMHHAETDAGIDQRHAGELLARTVEQAVASRLPVVVVTTRAHLPVVRRIVALRDVVLMGEPGMADAWGTDDVVAAAVAARGAARGWLLIPGDMARVAPATLCQVAHGLDRHPVALPRHRGAQGRLMAVGAELFAELVAMRGEGGLRRLLYRYPALHVDVDDPVVLDPETLPGPFDAALDGRRRVA